MLSRAVNKCTVSGNAIRLTHFGLFSILDNNWTWGYSIQKMRISKCTFAASIIHGNSVVELLFSGGVVRSFRITTNSDGASPEQGVISVFSPLGKALLGHFAGEELRYRAARGTETVRILSVSDL